MNRRRLLLFPALLGTLAWGALAQRFEFRMPRPVVYELNADGGNTTNWVSARRPGQARPVEFGRRVVVQTLGTNPPAFRRLTPALRLERRVNERTWLFEAATARGAVDAAATLAASPDVEVAIPTSRRRVRPHYPLAPTPNDPYYARQFSLQARDLTSPFLPVSVDLNVREAWAFTRGENIIVGVGDDGIEKSHPDLAANYAGPNYNFLTNVPNGDPMTTSLYHGTAVAGLVAAVGNNRTGLSGVAPRAKLASWVIFDDTETNEPDEAGFAAMFGTANQEVGVQNHSWGNADYSFVEVSLLENLALEKAVNDGRGGKGVVLVRSAGNTRQGYPGGPAGDANLDGYANDPRQITVAAVRMDGTVSSYSTPGACVLVAAPGGDVSNGFHGLVTTDRAGPSGRNTFVETSDPTSADYLVGNNLFVGTSAASPLVAGVAALVVAVRPELHWFEVQQILALSARHVAFTDTELRTNGAGLRVSPNLGFGVPDAGVAVRLARSWVPQPALETVRYTHAGTQLIPDSPPSGGSQPLHYEFNVTNALAVQHVQVHVLWSHPRGRDLRVRLTSPSGLASPLLRSGTEAEPVPAEWTFSSVEHLGESSQGAWVLEFTDTATGESGQVDEVSLILQGRGLTDTDRDGLDDDWERSAFGSLESQATDDPDGDGWNNAKEQMAGRDPTQADEAFVADIGRADDGRLRLSWPGVTHGNFQIWGSPAAGQPPTLMTNVPARFPESGWLFPPAGSQQLFEVRAMP